MFDIDLKNIRIVTVFANLFLRVQAASAAWNMGEWDQMAEYVSRLDDGDETKLRSLGNTAASGDGSSSGTFYRAVLLVRKGKVLSIFYVFCFILFALFFKGVLTPVFLSQYDEAREYVDRARKCLATELAALVSNPTHQTHTPQPKN